MDELSATLVRLLACTLPGVIAPELTLVPPSAIVAGLLRDLVGPDEAAGVAGALDDVAAGRLDLLVGLGQISAAVAPLDANPRLRPALAARLDTLGRAIGQAQGLSAAIGGGILERAELVLGDSALLALIQTLRLAPQGDEPAVIIVGAVSPMAGRVHIPLGQGKLLDRIDLAYGAESPYPLVTLRTASRGDEVDWAPDRAAWRQEPDLDLIVQNGTGSRDLGSIRTLVATAPWQYRGSRLAISLPAVAGHTLVETTVADLGGRPLAQCIRVYSVA